MNKMKISVRNGFSDRNGIDKINTTIQYKNLDNRSRTAIINLTRLIYKELKGRYYDFNKINGFWMSIMIDAYQQKVDLDMEYYRREHQMFEIIEDTITNGTYNEVLTLTELIINELEEFDSFNNLNIKKLYNDTFEKECVGYRFVNNQIVQITNEQEIESIEQATAISEDNVKNHLSKAITLLSDRKNHDYSNSIKESISAVEALCSNINGEKGTLGQALGKLKDNGVNIHPALFSAFNKLYGYTSDASGIRHAEGIGENEATFEEAKFMLVSCSAFVNYLYGVTQ